MKRFLMLAAVALTVSVFADTSKAASISDVQYSNWDASYSNGHRW